MQDASVRGDRRELNPARAQWPESYSTRHAGCAAAFAAGTLLTATAFELFEPARETAGLAAASVALGVGAGVFTLARPW